MASLAPGREVTSIFFGGGTPSLMEPQTVEYILDCIGKNWSISSDCEITMEANPSSVEAERFKAYCSAGVNRISLGVQSLDDKQLKFLGRLHNADEAKKAISIARETFPRISFDMIYARPEQTAQEWETELHQALDLAVDHLSLYQLTLEQGTQFFKLYEAGKLSPLGEDQAADLYELTQQVTAAHGFETYEISNHAKPGAQCQHNLVYWRGQEYAGVGPGAHGRIRVNEGRLATETYKSPEEWLQMARTNGHGMSESYVLLTEEVADELLLMGLRLAEGFDPVRYREATQFDFDPEKISFLKAIGMLEELDNGNFRATPAGFLVLDAVVADLASNPKDA